jgi:hypothetical protein
MTVRKYGWLPDLPDPRDRMLAPRPGTLPLPSESDIWKLVPRSRDQGQTGSCVGHGVVGALELERILIGDDDLPLSPRHCYTNARLLDMLPGEALLDNGAMVRSGMRVAHDLGVAGEVAYPLSESTIDDRPDAVADEGGLVFADVPYERVIGLDATLHALTNGAVVIGFDVPESFEAYSGGVWKPALGERMLGGHCVYLAGYRNGGAELMLLNSWGPGWGINFVNDNGEMIHSAMWVDASFVNSAYFGDAWAFSVKP